jgi:hypothetical protein
MQGSPCPDGGRSSKTSETSGCQGKGRRGGETPGSWRIIDPPCGLRGGSQLRLERGPAVSPADPHPVARRNVSRPHCLRGGKPEGPGRRRRAPCTTEPA